MNSKEVKFTVIIPTRERADTLEWTLKTCVTQDYQDLEIIVSDNFSQDNTREVVESYQDSRIKYINTGKRVSMSSNWEFALSHVEVDPERYVTFVGDDDGLLPNALEELNQLIQSLRDVEAIAWVKAQYCWKSCLINQNLLSVPLKKNLAKLETSSVLQAILAFDAKKKSSYADLPCLYNSFVRSTKIDEVKKKSKKFFCSMTPDVYSAIALSSVIECYYFSSQPYSVNGSSNHSNGVSYMYGVSLKGRQAALAFISEIDIPFHPDLVMCPSISIVVAESALQAKSNLNLDISIHIENMIDRALDEAKLHDSYKQQEVVNAITIIARNYQIDIRNKARIEKGIQKIILNTRKRLKKYLIFNQVFMFIYLLFKVGTLRVNGNFLKLENIYDATILTKKISRHKILSFWQNRT